MGSETRTAIARHELIEVVRINKDRQPLQDESLTGPLTGEGTLGVLRPIHVGRVAIEKDVFDAAAPKLAEFGIELLDVRFKCINYNQQVHERIYQQMISERLQIAERFRSEGKGETARINGNKERDLNQIKSAAYKQVQEIQGEADAKTTEIYAIAYAQSPESAKLYQFLKSMETYRKVINPMRLSCFQPTATCLPCLSGWNRKTIKPSLSNERLFYLVPKRKNYLS